MPLPPDFVEELRRHFAGDIRLDLASRTLYSTDGSIYQLEPLGVAIPRSEEDLQAAVELAAKYQVPILPRGAGSSLAGQAIGEALILDCSRWLCRILDINAEERRARVEPGVILESLNREAAKVGLQFGPDPASAERATMGGVIANNATGAHSIVHGMTADHLLSAKVLLADGSRAVLGEVRLPPEGDGGGAADVDHLPTGAAPPARYEALLEAALEVRGRYAEAIKTAYPRTWRNSAGYRLNYLLPWSPTAPPEWGAGRYPEGVGDGAINLANLLAGSEGTLAVLTEATVGLVPKPTHSLLGIIAYESIESACDAVPALLEHHPSAVELIPRMILRLAKGVAAYANQMDWLAGDPAAILVIEFSGDDERNVRSALSALGTDLVVAESASEQARVWNLRKVGLGILDSRPQSARPAAFIEDCAIPVERLGDFVREVQKIMAAFGTEGGIYAHASAGCLHIRPILDLKTAAGVRALRGIAEQTLSVTQRLGGSMASEHGDGIARGEWLRRTYGDEVAAAMLVVKKAADPQGLLNPGKMLDAPPMDSHLRYGQRYKAAAWQPGIDFGRNGGLAVAIEQCNGQGVCRKDTGVMCPSFQATREEMHSTRGRANLLRALIAGGSRLPMTQSAATQPQLTTAVFQSLDLCLACKGCKAECPSGVDMAKIKSTFLDEYHRTHARPLRDYLFGYFHVTARILSMMPGAVNSAARLPLFRSAVARLAGVTAHRPLPRFTNQFARIRGHAVHTPVLFLRDPFNHFVDTAVEQAAFDLLSSSGFEVRTLESIGAGAALVSKGFLNAARRHAQRLLAELGRDDPSHTLPIVTIEPSELSTLINDYSDLVPEALPALLQQISAASSVDELLLKLGAFSKIHTIAQHAPLLFHPHCHEKAERHSLGSDLVPTYAGLEMLRACGYDVRMVDAGCCGMAGTFGYEADHYDLSQKIAELRLFPEIRASGGQPVAASGAACRMQISQGTGVAALHPLVWATRALRPSQT